jgi:glycosyltransferase involved in cell wall biosynthesis
VRVGLDAQNGIGTATGLGEYTEGLALGLAACGIDVVRLCEPRLDPWRFDRRVLWDQVLLPSAARAAHVDLLHCTAGTVPAYLDRPCVVTVHDVAWLRAQAHARSYQRAYFGWFAILRYAQVDRIIASSEFSRREILAFTPLDAARISVVYPSVSADFARIERRPHAEPFILAVGTVERRKNLVTIVRALARVPGARLISVGPATPYRAECEAESRRLGVSDRVEFRGYVPRAELLDLYARAAVAVAPSTYEGFGYAAAQALCSGTPLVAADAASFPEVAGEFVPLVEPLDELAWAQALRAAIDDPAGAQFKAAAMRPAAIVRFGVDTTVHGVIEAYRDAFAAYASRCAR